MVLISNNVQVQITFKEGEMKTHVTKFMNNTETRNELSIRTDKSKQGITEVKPYILKT